jgi:MYXO-CTERM domain-containing protein
LHRRAERGTTSVVERKAAELVAAAVFGAGLCLASPARGNGVFPSVSQLVVEPGAPSHLYLRTTFGVVFSRDDGESWSWLCEDALGYTNTLPSIAVLEGGELLVGVPTGVSHGTVEGCGFELASGISANVVDLTVTRSGPPAVLALGVDFVSHVSQVWESTDAGRSFASLGAPFPDLQATTLDVAPSDPSVIYVTGMPTAGAAQGVLLRSRDHGASFDTLTIPDAVGEGWPYIGAVAPDDPDTLYVRLAGVPGRLKVSHDGGETFSEPLTLDYELQGFALTPDGQTVLASNPLAGTFRADTTSLAFEKIACFGVSCLKWSGSTLYACGDQTSDGFTVGVSRNEGQSYERLLDFECIQPYAGCADATPVGTICPPLWPWISQQLAGFGQCDAERPVPPANTQCFGAAGSPGAAGASSGSDGGTGGSSPTPKHEDAGCGCRVGGSSSNVPVLFALAASVVACFRRRRRKALRG